MTTKFKMLALSMLCGGAIASAPRSGFAGEAPSGAPAVAETTAEASSPAGPAEEPATGDSPANEGEGATHPAESAPTDREDGAAPAGRPVAEPLPTWPAPSEPAIQSPSRSDRPEPAGTYGAEVETSVADWPFIGGLIAVGAGAAFLVVGHYGMFRLNDVVREDDLRNYRAGVPEGDSSCDAARAGFVSSADGAPSPGAVEDLCDEAESLEILRDLAIPIGAVATVVGLLLIGTSDTVNGTAEDDAEQAGEWRLQVGAGPAGANAAVTVSF